MYLDYQSCQLVYLFNKRNALSHMDMEHKWMTTLYEYGVDNGVYINMYIPES